MKRAFLRCRKMIDTSVPSLGRWYRVSRDALNRRRSIQTPYGIVLAGEPRMASRDWEPEEISLFLELLEGHEIVVDIGANIGLYTCLAANHGKHTMAFEPCKRNLKFLTRNLWANRLSRVEVFPIGLGRSAGLFPIYGFSNMASFIPGWADAHNSQADIVALNTLDAIVAERLRGKSAVIKIDVEGFETEVLGGAEVTASLQPKPTWLIEILLRDEAIPNGINPRFAETFEFFARHGYNCRKIDSARSPVKLDDVYRWVQSGQVDGGTHDFLFSAS
jgi:FkbM family methyltransferase